MERTQGEGNINSIIERVNAITSKYQEAASFSVNPPAIQGLGMSSGLEMQILDISSLGTEALEEAVKTLQEAAADNPKIASITTTFQGSTPGPARHIRKRSPD